MLTVNWLVLVGGAHNLGNKDPEFLSEEQVGTL